MSTPETTQPPHLALSLDTADLPAGAAPLAALSALAQAAEAGGATALILRDALVADAEHGPRGLDASLAAASLGPLTSSLGLVVEVPSAVTEPFHTATAAQTLDHASLGRAGLALRTPSAAEIAASGERWAAAGAGSGERALLADASDSLEAIDRLWESWEPDAIIRDVSTGRFLDRNRIHDAAFAGETFTVEGASITPRSPQGRPPVFVTVSTAAEAALAGQRADVALLAPAGGASTVPDAGWLAPVRSLADAVLAEAAAERSALATEAAPALWLALPASLPAATIAVALGTARSAGLAVAGVSLRLDAGQAAPGAVSTLLAALGDAVPLPGHAASGTTLRAALGLSPALNPHAPARQLRLEEAI
ncbi:LLM class flavin-dependent oxidoreductase [Galactobacter valiniphilus]|uniref:LLM class flavin-dependent oxidoreductase n=1 Tax=Galactobacter valiniphilus TaxID=2676122 RepID=UPI003736B9CF